MTAPPQQVPGAIRGVIARFLGERLNAKLDGLPPDDPKRDSYAAQYAHAAWIEDAARRAGQIQAVTHTLKPIHSDAKGSNLYCPPGSLPAHDLVGSHCLAEDFATDIVGNAAALDVYKFLKLSCGGRTLLELLKAQDSEALAALSDDAGQAQQWAEAFTGITQPRGQPASHARAKQLYWLVGSDPANDAHFELLAPLYASSLAHHVYQTLQDDRFSDTSKERRQARREKRHHDGAIHDYPGLAVQKLGGTKPQNISQLNSERRGDNYLLASRPPQWELRDVHLPVRTQEGSIFPGFGKREAVRDIVDSLRGFLLSRPPSNMHTRNTRDALLVQLIDELLFYAAELWAFPPGWSAQAECNLKRSQQLWLDVGRAGIDTAFAVEWRNQAWINEVRNDFASWLNGRLRNKLGVGDAEHRQWSDDLGSDALWLDLAVLNLKWAEEFEPEQALPSDEHAPGSGESGDDLPANRTAPEENPA